MSSVLARLRSTSQLEIFNNGENLRAELTRFVWNTNNVPKGWRDTFTKPMCALLQELFHHMNVGNRIRATNEAILEQRKEEQQKAIDTLKDIYALINYMATTLPIDWNKFDNILKMMIRQEKLLKAWKKASKIVNP